MHDVAEELHLHILSNLDTGRFRDAANIVTPQVYQHSMFCCFLLIREEVSRQGLVFFIRSPSWSRPCNRIGCHDAIFDRN
ncbi:Uncharacterised protein [Streptococcus pneumoniae]|nr:Uncharacterised protein [Streptococcus pneumoniae]